MKIIWNLAKVIAGAVLGLVLAKWKNVFASLSFVPQEYAYDICVTVYISVCEILIGSMLDGILKCLRKRFVSKISVTIFLPQSGADIKHNPDIQFNQDGIAETIVEVEYDGLRRHFKGSKLVFRHLAFADIQYNAIREEVSLHDGDYELDLETLFGGVEKHSVGKNRYRLLLIQYPTDAESSARFEPEITKKSWFLRFRKNYAQIRTVVNYGRNN